LALLSRQVTETRQVQRVRPIAVEVLALEARHRRGRADAVVMDHDVAAQRAAAVRQTLRMLLGARIQQHLRRCERRGAEEDDSRRVLLSRASSRIDDSHTGHTTFLMVVLQRLNQRIGSQRKVSSLRGCRQRRALTAEVRTDRTTARAGTAVVTGAPIAERLREHRDAADRDATLRIFRFDALFEGLLDDVHRHRRLELAIGQLRQPFGLAAHSDELLDVRIPWPDVAITNRPVDAVSVLLVRVEVEIAEAINVTSPHERAPADYVRPKPVERHP